MVAFAGMVAGSFGKVIAAEMLPRSLATVALVPGGNDGCDERRRQSLGVGRVQLPSLPAASKGRRWWRLAGRGVVVEHLLADGNAWPHAAIEEMLLAKEAGPDLFGGRAGRLARTWTGRGRAMKRT